MFINYYRRTDIIIAIIIAFIIDYYKLLQKKSILNKEITLLLLFKMQVMLMPTCISVDLE